MTKEEQVLKAFSDYMKISKRIKFLSRAREMFKKQSDDYLTEIRTLNMNRVNLVKNTKEILTDEVQEFLGKVV